LAANPAFSDAPPDLNEVEELPMTWQRCLPLKTAALGELPLSS